VIKKIPLSGVPNLIAPTPDGRRLYVGIALAWDDMSAFPEIRAAASGGIDLIDTVSLENVKTIPIGGGIHDLYVTPDGKYLIAGAVRAAKPPTNLMSVIDTRANEIAWTFAMSPAPSPMAITANSDGSTNKIYAQNTRHGFAVIDFATHLQTNFIDLPTVPAAQQNRFGGASHGIAVTADQKTLLVNSSRNSALYAYSLPDLTLLGGAALGGKGANWLTISPGWVRAVTEHRMDGAVGDTNERRIAGRRITDADRTRCSLWGNDGPALWCALGCFEQGIGSVDWPTWVRSLQ
jgi:DNA-binding beta-propeller fold protein YncE